MGICWGSPESLVSFFFIDIFVLRCKKPAPQNVLSRVRLLYRNFNDIFFQDACFLKSFFSNLAKLNPFVYILKLSGTIQNTNQEDKNKEAIGEKKWISKKPAERMDDQLKTFSISRRFSNHSTSSPNIHYKDSNVSPENTLFLSKSCPSIFSFKSDSRIILKRSCPNIYTSYSAVDSSEDNSCSSNSTPAFITAPDATPAGSISSSCSFYSG